MEYFRKPKKKNMHDAAINYKEGGRPRYTMEERGFIITSTANMKDVWNRMVYKAGRQDAQMQATTCYSQDVMRLILDYRSEIRNLKRERIAEGEVAKQEEVLKQQIAI